MRGWKAVCAAAAMVLALAPGANADDWNKKTFLTFSGPVQIPGATLPAGTYTFKLADLQGNRHVVQIFDKDEKKIYATLLAIPDQRLEPSDKPVVMFTERAAGAPQAIKAWFYPGETVGNEFVYPRRQAVAIAKATHTSVLTMDETASTTTTSETTTDADRRAAMTGTTIGRVGENGVVEGNVAPPPDDAALKNGSSAQAAPETTGTTIGTAGSAAGGRRSLPRTASPLALYGLLSGLSLFGAAGLRRLR